MRMRISRAVVVAVSLVVVIGGTATAVGAKSSSSEARGAVDAIDDEFDVSPSERQCLMKAMVRDAKLVVGVRQVALDMNPTARQQAAVLKVLTRCAPRAIAGALLGEDEVEDLGASPEEVRCMVRGFPDLDDTVLIAASRNKIEALDGEAQSSVGSLAFRCMPTLMGKRFLQGMASSADDIELPSSSEQHRCVGEGLVDAFPAGSLPSVDAMQASPELALAVVHVVARCSPEFLVDLYTSQIAGGGASRKAASCIATRIVADSALLDTLVTADGSDSASVPPAIAEVAAACS